MKPIVLIIMDGIGINPNKEGNAFALANIPHLKEIQKFYPGVAIHASGINVGIKWGEVGNSEVGHTNLGAGTVLYQKLPRINIAIQDKSFFEIEAFKKAILHVQKNRSSLHLMGLVSNGGVHSHIDHLCALIELAKKERLKKVFIHVFTDGRDTSPNEGINFVKDLEKKMKKFRLGQIASIVGRFYGMDRNNNWERTEKAYNLLTEGIGEKFSQTASAIEKSYKEKITDEFIKPIVLTDRRGNPIGPIKDNDGLIFFNFRGDRAKQITQAFVSPRFKEFKREKLKNICFVAMTEYQEGLPMLVAFPSQDITNPFAKVISDAGLKQLHTAETEKYAHVTFFFNGGKEDPFPGEDRILIPSPSVPTYDLKPEMSAPLVTEKLVKEIEKGKYDFIVVNFANGDMVGHTGNLKAAIKAVETVDECVDKVVNATLKMKGGLVITADHGNCEEMINLETKEILTDHTTNPVPLWVVTPWNKQKQKIQIPDTSVIVGGILADVAPTIIELMGLEKPAEMTGSSLLKIITKCVGCL
ncbi:MAG: 2,3-bisphosphoglycerate-independent phosphoglycerate mutase [Parcubacteria group bacterium CG_4_10_14_0_8_um_filter_35_7]|nr:MAG: phosphoglycerate mutase (2,3-diphosphoglycerate-independent) [Parcubacteria group bacterium CG23_combo_of_CG06-09_8_20_14_all_35_9]PIY78805.1 MAG: 2,3-bisphosphoglycerate-independent phosphoglycerate mutase [Parcubacteria group bacterium CG_4_10_14_0_8_um_filter_35_7]